MIVEQHTKVIARKCKTITREIDAIRAKNQAGKEGKRYTIEGQDNTIGKSNELT